MYDARARICKESADTLKEHFKGACLDPVHYAIRAKEAPAQGKTLFEYAPTSPAAIDYERLAERLLAQVSSSDPAGRRQDDGPQERPLYQAAGGDA
jgi:cellulose biosynthesis protein BcsQ